MSSDKGEYNPKSSTKLLAMGYSATLGVFNKGLFSQSWCYEVILFPDPWLASQIFAA